MANYGRRYNQYQTYEDNSGDNRYHPQANFLGNNSYYAPSQPGYGYTQQPNPYSSPSQPGYGYASPNPYNQPSQPGYGYASPNPYNSPSQPGYGYAQPNPYYAPPQPSYYDTGATHHMTAGSSHVEPMGQYEGPYVNKNGWQDDDARSTGSVSVEDDAGGDYPVEVEEWNDGEQTSGFNRTMMKPKGNPRQQPKPNPQPRANPGPRSRVNPRPARRR
ncbi:hypothetical protein M5689_022593 [Euphorbia peplus]|nr:hypothetical protein M5689_022593 [Euphorbia peplus]